MIDLRKIEGIYFVGIGGIGMSALAKYFAEGGYNVAGYDRTESPITQNLSEAGCNIITTDRIESVPGFFTEAGSVEKVLVVFTPAIPADNQILSFFRKSGYNICKRSEILGLLSSNTDTLAVAGTHGKTTVSTMIAHFLKQSHIDCSAFLGGISKNYNSNLLTGNSSFTVMEADEFDRSFHQLSPLMAVITSLDADHLDIYGDHETMIEAYNIFAGKLRKGGFLLVNKSVDHLVDRPEGVEVMTYGSHTDADCRYSDVSNKGGYYTFNIETPFGTVTDVRLDFPGIINIENMTAAAAIALKCGVSGDEIRKAAFLFRGVKRRFDVRINTPSIAYIDDYAHHPEEIRAFVKSVREYFPGRRITAIFQPHLYSRTLDHAAGFAEILDQLDEVILLPVYPAREKPIPGVESDIILDKMKIGKRRIVGKDKLLSSLNFNDIDVLATIGAGDIDMLAEPIEKMIKTKSK